MFLQRAEMAGETAAENWRLFPQDFRDRNDTSVAHKRVGGGEGEAAGATASGHTQQRSGSPVCGCGFYTCIYS